MAIKGNGTTSATTALLVQNSAGTDLLKVRDDGNVYITSLRSRTNGGVYQNMLSSIEWGGAVNYNFNSTTGGLRPPTMTTTQRDAISSPAAGLMVYNTTTNKAQCYNGSTWNDLF